MKIYIVTDLEGPAGVSRWVQTREGETPEKRAAMSLLTAEVNAAVEGIFEAAPDAEVIVRDGHGSGGIIFEELHPAVQVIMQGALPRHDSAIQIAFACDALMFVGQHAMAGAEAAPLCHTFSSRSIEYYKLNGAFIGEIGCIAARLGEHDVPTIFLSGDDKACREARMHVPEMVTVATKQGLGVQMALHLSAATARQRIRAGAAEAVRQRKAIPPFRPAPPYELEIRVLEGVDTGNWLRTGHYERLDERTIVRRAARVNDLFAL